MTPAKISKAERRVVSTAMKMHTYNPANKGLDEYRAHKAYLLGQLHRACDALDKAKERIRRADDRSAG